MVYEIAKLELFLCCKLYLVSKGTLYLGFVLNGHGQIGKSFSELVYCSEEYATLNQVHVLFFLYSLSRERSLTLGGLHSDRSLAVLTRMVVVCLFDHRPFSHTTLFIDRLQSRVTGLPDKTSTSTLLGVFFFKLNLQFLSAAGGIANVGGKKKKKRKKE